MAARKKPTSKQKPAAKRSAKASPKAKAKPKPKPKAAPKSKAKGKPKARPKTKPKAKARPAASKAVAARKRAQSKASASKARSKPKAKPAPKPEDATPPTAPVETPPVPADTSVVQDAPAAAAPPTLEAPVVEEVVEEVAETPRPTPIPAMPARRKDGTITIALSPDADDAFMFFGLMTGKVETEDRTYDLVRDEIQVLNEKALKGVYDVTAISFGAWPYLRERYLLLPCGASFGDGRGPILIAQSPIRTHEVNGLKVAVPGRNTTAALALRVWLPHAKLDLIEYPFDEVIPAVRRGHARAGVLIHERQLTWQEENFVRVVDFGQWWSEKTEGLPLPLGANAIRRDIPEEERAKIALDIKRSIAYGLGHREDALDFSMQYAKGLPRQLVDRYVGMYVNELTLDCAERGRQAVSLFLGEARRLGLVAEDTEPEFS